MRRSSELMPPVELPSRVTSIFFLTSIFNNSIQSSIAVFHLGRTSMKNGKGRIATWQPRKRVVRKRRAARRSNSSSATQDRGRASVPCVIFCRCALDRFAVPMLLLHLMQVARRDSGLAADLPERIPVALLHTEFWEMVLCCARGVGAGRCSRFSLFSAWASRQICSAPLAGPWLR
jgi:hypothetical protein